MSPLVPSEEPAGRSLLYQGGSRQHGCPGLRELLVPLLQKLLRPASAQGLDAAPRGTSLSVVVSPNRLLSCLLRSHLRKGADSC